MMPEGAGILIGPMHVLLAAWLAISSVAAPPPPAPPGVAVVPDEPGALVLDDPLTLQAVVADLRGSGSPDLVRLLRAEDGAVLVDVWRHGEGEWSRIGEPIEARPAPLERFDVPDNAGPVRLLVRRTGDSERVTLVRQPAFRGPSLEPSCCLELSDIAVATGGLDLIPVGSAPEAVDALLVLDLDGDQTDELLASRSLPPLGRTAYPSQALVFRWLGDAFGPPVLTELPVGSGDTPFVLGETDGLPGDEAGLIGTAAQSRLYRIVLDGEDRVRAEPAGAVVSSVAAVVVGDRPAVAIAGPRGLSVHRWPAGAELGAALGEQRDVEGRLLGGVVGPAGPVLVAEIEASVPTQVRTLPALGLEGGPVASGAAIRAITRSSLRPYRGPLPGGDPDGVPASWHDGVLTRDSDASPLVAALGDARPIGFAGPERSWLVIAHGLAPDAPGPSGGRLEPIGVPQSGTIALVPASVALVPERDNGALQPVTRDTVILDAAGTLGIAPAGFGVVIEAPPGSRAWAGLGAGATSLGVHVVPASGSLEIRLPLPRSVLPYSGDRAWVAVVSPAGATYTAVLDVLALTGPPPLDAAAGTAVGSGAVDVRGETVAHATVTVAGRPTVVGSDGTFSALVDLPPWPTEIEVVASDALGNEARLVLTGSGFVDYGSLPWLGIATAVVGIAAAGLYVRPRSRKPGGVRSYGGDGVVEDLDPESGT